MIIIKKLENFQSKFKIRNKKILILTSPSIIKKNRVRKLIRGLTFENNVEVFSKILPGAYLKDLQRIFQFKTPQNIIGIGGGSVIDIAKAYSCLKLNSVKNLNKEEKINKIPLIVIPTISGSGAESSKGSILKKTNNKKIAYRSEHLIPDHVFLDLSLVKSAPKKLRCECLFDCLSHAIETYLSKKSKINLKKNSIKTIKSLLKINYKNIDTIKYQKIISKSSYLMGINLKMSTTCLPHRIQYSLSEYTNMTHAQSIIALYTGWLKIISETKEFKQLEKEISIKFNLKNKIKMFKKKLKINFSLRKLKLSEQTKEKIIKKTNGTLKLDPSYKSINTIRQIVYLSS